MIIHGDSLEKLKDVADQSVDLLCTDPPYGYSFMGKAWDKTLPDIGIFKECHRVLKPGAFAFVMSAPRSDVCARMMLMLEDAGFEIGFTPIYWTYASGFPKALSVAKNIGKIADEVCELLTNASTAIQSSSDTLANTKVGVRIAVQSVEVSPKQLSFNVLVEFPSESLGASTDKLTNITVPAIALIEECERALNKIKGGVLSKTELGNPKFWRRVDFDALCAELIDGWKRIIFSKLETDPTFATTFQTECVSATTVTITASITERLISSTANTLAKKLGGAREIVGRSNRAIAANPTATDYNGTSTFAETAEQREASKWLTRGEHELEGSYGGFQPKPAVEVIIVAMKPLSEKTFVDQALKNGKGITWLDDCRVPGTVNPKDYGRGGGWAFRGEEGMAPVPHASGRFPANLLVSDDVLNDGKERKSAGGESNKYGDGKSFGSTKGIYHHFQDTGSYSRYFDLDAWAKTYPFLIVPKASKGEKNAGLDGTCTVKYNEGTCQENKLALTLLEKVTSDIPGVKWSIGESGVSIMAQCQSDSLSTTLITIKKTTGLRILHSLMLSLTKESTEGANSEMASGGNHAESAELLKKLILTTTNAKTELVLGASRVAYKMLSLISEEGNWNVTKNVHSTVKPLKLISYLITLGSRPGDVVLDPFLGSGTTAVAAKMLNRECIGIEREEEYVKIAEARLNAVPEQLPLQEKK